MPEPCSSLAKPLLDVFKFAWPKLKVLHAEKEAVFVPAVSRYIDEALVRLGGGKEHDSWWRRIVPGVEAAYTRPEFFGKAAVREWLRDERVRRDFHLLAENKIGGTEDDGQARGRLALAYSRATGEDARLAAGPIGLVLDVVGAGLLARLTPGEGVLLGVVEHGFKEVLAAVESFRSAYQMGLPSGMRQFRNHYLGVPGEPKPFGGRQKQLQELDHWLSDADAPRRQLLTAEAGRGKSCLLAHWLERLPQGWKAVFMPVSIRFQLSTSRQFFAALAAQFAALLGDTLPANPNDLEEVHRGYLIEAMDRAGEERIVLVLDGLDEAVGWEIGDFLSPVNCPMPKVLVSCRLMADQDQAHWLRRVGWNAGNAATWTLPGLDEPGVRDVLDKMGAPLDEIEGGVVRELHRLSEGDPLIVGFYAEELWTRKDEAPRLKPGDLSELESGFNGFFSNWMERHHKDWDKSACDEKLHAILALLACACGPLQHGDIESLLGHMGVAPAYCTSRDLAPVRRFVVGGRYGTGYSFSHPKLGDFMRHDFFRDGELVHRARKAFPAWGAAVVQGLNAGAMAYLDCPEYLLRHYVQHLAAAQAGLPECMRLVDEGWMRAREARDGGLNGFFGDVAAIRAMAEAAAPANDPLATLGERIRCVLVQSSIFSISSNLPPELVAAAVRHGLMSREGAVHLLFFLNTHHTAATFEALLSLGLDLAQERNASLRALLVEAALGVGDAEDRALVLGSLSAHLPEGERAMMLDLALEAASEIEVPWRRASSLRNVAACIPEGERVRVLGPALGTTGEIESTWFGYEPTPSPGGKLLRISPEAAQGIEDAGGRAFVLSDLSQDLHEDERTRAVAGLLEEAMETKNAADRADALRGLVPYLTKEMLAVALDEIKGIGDVSPRVDILFKLTTWLQDELLPMTLVAVAEIENPRERVDSLCRLAAVLPEDKLAGVLDQARDVAMEIRHADDRAIALGKLARHLPEREQAELLGQALGIVKGIMSTWDRAMTLGKLARYLPDGLLADALETAKGIREEEYRALAFCRLAPHLTKELLAEALEATKEFRDETHRATALGTLDPTSPEGADAERAASVKRVADEDDWTLVIDCKIPPMPEEECAYALEAVERIVPEEVRASVLSRLARSLSKDLLPDALEIATGIQNAFTRESAIYELVQNLPECLLADARQAAMNLGNAGDRACALVLLSRRMPEGEETEALGEAMKAFEEVVGNGERLHLLYIVPPSQPGWWSASLDALSGVKRGRALRFLAGERVLEHIAGLGNGRDVLWAVAGAVRDTCGWWP